MITCCDLCARLRDGESGEDGGRSQTQESARAKESIVAGTTHPLQGQKQGLPSESRATVTRSSVSSGSAERV